jgi:hypothetical protein
MTATAVNLPVVTYANWFSYMTATVPLFLTVRAVFARARQVRVVDIELGRFKISKTYGSRPWSGCAASSCRF